ncbi:MAG: hypothetical protein J5851_09430 [Oscillospiraceae bacterium]|nr:hypothetical protein [Oscillospiraceae bacterium]
MQPIRDIRLYRSQTENTDGHAMPQGFSNFTLHIQMHRIAMKLGENGFTAGDFHHLYINLTTCTVEGKTAPARRTPDRYHPWYRYYDVQISQELYDALETPACIRPVTAFVKELLVKHFAASQADAALIRSCICEAETRGADMLVQFKEKQSAKNRAVIYLRYLDNGRYRPLLRVFDLHDTLLLEQDLPETHALDAYGEILLSAKKVTVKPRKNALAGDLAPITFQL